MPSPIKSDVEARPWPAALLPPRITRLIDSQYLGAIAKQPEISFLAAPVQASAK